MNAQPVWEIELSESPKEGDPSRQMRADAIADRRRLMTTAEGLFAERGIEQVNMVDIARSAEVGQGTLYRHFANKSELCQALVDTQAREGQDDTLAHLRQMAAEKRPILEQLAWFVEAQVWFFERHAPLMRAVFAENTTTPLSDEPPHYWAALTIQGLLRQAQATGEIASDVDVPYTVDAFLRLIHPHTLYLHRQQRNYTVERIVAGLQRFIYALGRDGK